MTIKKTTDRSTVAAITKDLDFIQEKFTEHKTELEDALTRRVDAEKKQTEIIVDARSYGQEKASKQVKECKQIVASSIADEREAEDLLEGCHKRITELEESLNQAKQRDVKVQVEKFGEQLEGEAPGLQKLLENFTNRIDEMLKSCAPVDGKIRELGAAYHLRIKIENALSGWLAAQMYHVFPRKFERPHRAPIKDETGSRPFAFDGELKDVLARQFEGILGNPKLTETLQPLIVSDENFRVVSREENEEHQALADKMKQDAAQMKAGVA